MTLIVDSHQHFWNTDRFHYPWMKSAPELLQRDFLPEHLRPHLGRMGVDKSIVIQAQPQLPLEETCWLLELAETEGFIAGVIGWIDPAAPHLDPFIEMFASRPMLRGLRCLHDAPDDEWQVSDDVIRGLSVLGQHDLTYDLIFRPRQIVQVPVLARKLPELKMVIDHIGKPPVKKGVMEGWFQGMKEAASFPNVYGKLSGLVTAADWRHWKADDLKPYVETVVELFGFERLMFGSDWPFCLLAASYDRVIEALVECLGDISESEREMVFGGTATDVYGLDQVEAVVPEMDPELEQVSQPEEAC